MNDYFGERNSFMTYISKLKKKKEKIYTVKPLNIALSVHDKGQEEKVICDDRAK